MEGRAWTVRMHGRKAVNASLGCSPGKSQLTADSKSPLSSFKMSAPERIWKHFSNSSLGQKWGRGRASTWRECVYRQTCVSGCKQTDHTSFHRGILICTLALGYFYIWMMSDHLDEIEMFCFVAQVSTIAKSSHETFLPSMYQKTERNGLIKLLVSIDEKYTRNHLFSGASDAWCVCHFLWWERSMIAAAGPELELIKNKIG